MYITTTPCIKFSPYDEKEGYDFGARRRHIYPRPMLEMRMKPALNAVASREQHRPGITIYIHRASAPARLLLLVF
jgi:hypothetical protein